MGTRILTREFRTSPAVFLAFMTLIGLVLCLGAMHSSLAVSNSNMATGTATALIAQQEQPSAQASGVTGEVASCRGSCGQDHLMMVATCAVALLVPLMFIGTARITNAWRPFAGRMQSFLQRVGAVAPPMPPSLLALSISRT